MLSVLVLLEIHFGTTPHSHSQCPHLSHHSFIFKEIPLNKYVCVCLSVCCVFVCMCVCVVQCWGLNPEPYTCQASVLQLGHLFFSPYRFLLMGHLLKVVPYHTKGRTEHLPCPSSAAETSLTLFYLSLCSFHGFLGIIVFSFRPHPTSPCLASFFNLCVTQRTRNCARASWPAPFTGL